MNTRSLYYDLDQIAASGLIPPDRWTQLIADLDARTSFPLTPEGKPIQNARLFLYPDGKHYLYVTLDERSLQYGRRELLVQLLTDDEYVRIRDYASAAIDRKTEDARMAKAIKVPANEYQGYLLWGDDWYASADEVYERIVADNDELPEDELYAWAATPEPVIVGLTVDNITEHLICDRGWEDMSVDDLEGVSELQAALDAFVRANEKVVSYQPDYSRAIVLDRAEIGRMMEDV